MKELPFILKTSLIILLALYGSYCAFRPAEWHLIDGVNLVAHEAGHMLFGWFGEFIGVMGGTMSQLLAPAAITAYFYFQQARYSSAITLFWFGQNFINISVYVKDAQAMNLPLVSIGGSPDAIHDWHFMLSRFGLLKYDQSIGSTILGLGVMIMLLALIAAFFYALRANDNIPE